MFAKSVLVAGLAAVATARKCIDLKVPVDIEARNAVYNLEPLLTKTDVTDFYLRFGSQGHNYSQEILEGYATVSGSYVLGATYCEPDYGPGDVLQIMTHGVGFDREYWDIPYHNYNYSYVADAVDVHGHSTLAWDRLGISNSSKGDPISEIQIFLEIAALRALTDKARDGKLPKVGGKGFDTVFHVGHSFGAAMTYALSAGYPDETDGIILTGFTQVSSYIGYFALGGNFAPLNEIERRLGGYPKGYVGTDSIIGSHINFFAPGDFDEGLLKYYDARARPNTPGEILTVGAGGGDINSFPGPVLIVTGEKDIPFCGGDCKLTSSINGAADNLVAFSERFFPEASYFNATVVPGAGHGLNMGYSHIFTFDTMLDFIDTHA